jgi:hypothetical protein
LRKVLFVVPAVACSDQAPPSQYSMKALGWNPAPPPPPLLPEAPTAQQLVASGQVTPLRMSATVPGGFGLAVSDHTDPFHRSTNVTPELPELSVLDPVAQQSAADAQVTALR